MHKFDTPLTREQWLQTCAELMMDECIANVCNIRSNLKFRISVGFPPNTKPNSSKVGVCFASRTSKEGYNEIYINPQISDSITVLGVTMHELIHAVDDCKNAHSGFFAKVFKAVGMIGSKTESTPGPELIELFSSYVDLLGPLPHCKLELSNLPKQIGRNLKVFCTGIEDENEKPCGFTTRCSLMQYERAIEKNGAFLCPVCYSNCDIEIK